MEVLDLGNNGMTESSAISLAACLQKHRDLRDLNLYMNAIGSDGLEKVNSFQATS
jgi:Ran GTPase-activating protein (RanGAP) involved in mRNA processing and transport